MNFHSEIQEFINKKAVVICRFEHYLVLVSVFGNLEDFYFFVNSKYLILTGRQDLYFQKIFGREYVPPKKYFASDQTSLILI